MIDGDVIFDASWIQTWKQEYAFLTGMPVADGRRAADRSAGCRPRWPCGEVISPIMAAKQGFGLPLPLRRRAAPADRGEPHRRAAGRARPGRLERPPGPAPPAPGSRAGSPPASTAYGHASRARPGRDRAGRAASDKTGRTRTRSKDKKDEGRAEAPRGVPRPGDQGSGDARGRPLARPAAQLQGQHHARPPTSSTTPRSPGSRGWPAA